MSASSAAVIVPADLAPIAHWLGANRLRDALRDAGVRCVGVSAERVHVSRRCRIVFDAAVKLSSGATQRGFFEHVPDVSAQIDKIFNKFGAIAPDWLVGMPRSQLVYRIAGLDERLGLHPNQLASAANGRTDETGAVVNLLAHRLGKRAVLRVSAAGDAQHVVKLYKPSAASRLQTTVATLQQLAQLRSPFEQPCFTALSDHDVRRGRLVFDHVDGAAVTCLPVVEQASAIERTGRALRWLHDSGVATERAHGPLDEVALLEHKTKLVGTIYPDLFEPLTEAFDRVRRQLLSLPIARTVTVHRDFYDKQVLINDGLPTMVDFDTLAAGDAALDLGNYLAHVELRRLQESTVADEAESAMISGYGECGTVRERIATWRDAALLRLAAIYALRPRWQHLPPQILERLNG